MHQAPRATKGDTQAKLVSRVRHLIWILAGEQEDEVSIDLAFQLPGLGEAINRVREVLPDEAVE